MQMSEPHSRDRIWRQTSRPLMSGMTDIAQNYVWAVAFRKFQRGGSVKCRFGLMSGMAQQHTHRVSRILAVIDDENS